MKKILIGLFLCFSIGLTGMGGTEIACPLCSSLREPSSSTQRIEQSKSRSQCEQRVLARLLGEERRIFSGRDEAKFAFGRKKLLN